MASFQLSTPAEAFAADTLYILTASKGGCTSSGGSVDRTGHITILLAAVERVTGCKAGEETRVEGVAGTDTIHYVLVEQGRLFAVGHTFAHENAAFAAALDDSGIGVRTDFFDSLFYCLGAGEELQFGLIATSSSGRSISRPAPPATRRRVTSARKNVRQ